MPHLSRKAIEAIAQRIIFAYKKLPALQGQQVDFVQPELLARDLLGLTVEHHTLSRDGRILGLTSCGEVDVLVFDDPKHPNYLHLDGKTLLIDQGLAKEGANRGRRHFTITHETCHQIFKMLYPKEYAVPARWNRVHCCSSVPAENGEYWEEWRTNALASAVLMPEEMVRNNMAAFGLGEKVEMLNSVFAQDQYIRFSDMANHMGVSKQALAIRLNGLGFLGREFLQDPYAFVNVCPDDKELELL